MFTELQAIFGHVVEFSIDQHGSRFIQAQLETATECEKAIVFSELYPRDVDKLVRDVFGNYVSRCRIGPQNMFCLSFQCRPPGASEIS